jgi:hypothetical protein
LKTLGDPKSNSGPLGLAFSTARHFPRVTVLTATFNWKTESGLEPRHGVLQNEPSMNIQVSLEWAAVTEIKNELQALNATLKRIADGLNPVAERLLFFEIDANGKQKRILGGKMFLKVTETKKFMIKPVDARGNAALIDGAASWAVTDENLADLIMGEDGLVEVVPKGPMGAFKLQVKADADMGEGVKEIFGELEIELVAGEAVAIEISPAE